ncbi:MAG TPA: hypothetical protein IAB30_01090 [Candidatus Fimenecus excrementavium]|nr:hypothetical protein [Candidatus Fimenecus excrementavium]
MWKRFSAFLLMVLCVCCSACTQSLQLPPETDFSADVEIVSAELNTDGTYALRVKTAVKNNSEQDCLIYGNPTCWNEVYINERGETKDLPLGSYVLKCGEELVEEKTVTLSPEEMKNGNLHTETKFYIEYGKGKKQNYIVKSDYILLSEVKSND